MSTCTIEGCDKPLRSRGWCEMHYARWRNNGDPLVTRRPTLGMSIEERFWLHVSMPEGDGCWEWTSSKHAGGYGHHYIGRGQVKAHRYAYELLIGPIPEGLHLDHLCRNRACVNPAHLEPVTNAENSRRGALERVACPKGHPYDEHNTMRTKQGDRACRECNRLNSARWRAERARVVA